MSFPTQGYTPAPVVFGRLRDSIGSTVLTVNQEWFASDIIPSVDDDLSADLAIEFAFEKRAIIEVTLDSGVTFFRLNNNNKAEAETLNSFAFPALNTDLINFRADIAGTLRFARVLEYP